MKKYSQPRKMLMLLALAGVIGSTFNCTCTYAGEINRRGRDEAVKRESIANCAVLASMDSCNNSYSINNLVNYARTCIGKPYVYGAAGPNAFDCSGLVQYVYKNAGINLSRTTYTQVNEGREVNRNELKPGDLVFFNTTGHLSHVGLYIGEGNFLHAPRTGKNVMITSMKEGYFADRFETARRVMEF